MATHVITIITPALGLLAFIGGVIGGYCYMNKKNKK